MYIVPLDGPDIRFLGGSARARNARIAERAGADVRQLQALPTGGSDTAILVPADAALMLSLFRDPVFIDSARHQSVVWLEGDSGAAVLVGPAGDVSRNLHEDVRAATLPRLKVAAGRILNIATPAQRRGAKRVVLLATEKATDGWVSRHWNRPVSRLFSGASLRVGLSASTASFLTLLVGLGGAWVAAQPGPLALVAACLLFQFASILDGVDGEIARATLTESESGARVDTMVDQITYVAFFAGSTIGWMREGSGLLALRFTAFIGVALVVSLLRGGRFVARHAEDASFVFIDRSVRRAARDTGRLPLRMAAGAFTMLRRDLFAVIFLGAALTGQRASIPGLVLVGVLIANLTFTFYREELAEAARAERGLPPSQMADA